MMCTSGTQGSSSEGQEPQKNLRILQIIAPYHTMRHARHADCCGDCCGEPSGMHGTVRRRRQDLAASECRSFLRTSAGRQELKEARVVARERRRLQAAKMLVGSGGGGGGGSRGRVVAGDGARERSLTLGPRTLLT